MGLVAAGVFAGGAGVAVAASWHGMQLKSAGASFSGWYLFNKRGVNHGAFEWKGTLKDQDRTDGHNAYIETKIEGHDWTRTYGKQGKAVNLHRSHWDGAQAYTRDAYMRVCRDRGSLHPDNCSSTMHRKNPAAD
ncbi:hypothetical protein IAG42_24185 [Streptomyces xanthii]|uniref:Uncharacterized protein n=1 Tax=Streptomyces xanthii TaxID=2768069 RepID=A0A7H1BJL3_9ACTN|nr:hypothetical protein IAG42_24185 [Streptomyces xanthii]